MDEINSFFNIDSNFKRESVPSGYVNGRCATQPETNKYFQREFYGNEYGEEYRAAQLEELKKIPETNNEFAEQDADDVHNRYNFVRKLPDLPIVEMKDLILRTVEANPVVIIEGATGCGKTTQVPQFLLDEGYENRRRVNIVVTQPRRIAAISIATRVAKERELPLELPHLIGFQIGLNNRTNDDTRLTYCTTGVLLEKLVASKTLANYTHIILDEVHERSQDMDFLFIVIKQLRHTAPHVRIILMSATIEATEFASYFSFYRGGPNGCFTPAPVIKVDKKSNFKIRIFYLDDLQKLKVSCDPPSGPGIETEMYMTATKLIYLANRLDDADGLPPDRKPSILIFLPGVYEINLMKNYIDDYGKAMKEDNIVVVLHSMIKHEEQIRALRSPTVGKRMIILATNIAESSITVPDVKYVIDFCLTKTNVTDTTTNFTSLHLEWCSRNNCQQRAGRTGRTMDGRVYRLVTKHFYEKQIPESNRPEMCRSPLENVILKAKQLEMGPPCKIISLAMDRPTMFDLRNTILLLKETGALLRTCDGVYLDEDGDMTFIGRIMATLPVNVNVAKLVVLGYCFSVLSECIIIAAGLTTKSIFTQGITNAVTYYSKKLVWSDGSGSDLFAILKAYKAYKDRVQTHGERATGNWASRYYLNEKSLIEMSYLVADITERLDRLGIRERTGVHRAKWSPAETSIILKVVIAGAFYPNYFVRLSNEMGDRETFRTINGRNPSNTVYFSGFEEKYIRQLYVQSIKKLLKPCTNSPDNIQVTFDEGNEKVFVTFRQTKASLEANIDPDLKCTEMGPGQVCIEVYKALKMKSSSNLQIRVMHPIEAQKYVDKMNIGSLVAGKWECKRNTIKNIEKLCLPRKHVKSVTGKITHYDTNFNRFWLRSVDEEKLFDEIQSQLNSLSRDFEPITDISQIHTGQVVAAPYNGLYYRARILLIVRGTSKIFVNVLLIDIGLEGDLEMTQLRRLSGKSYNCIDIPPRVFECRLACLQPSELHLTRYGWGSTMSELRKLTEGQIVCAEIYSVENGVASVFIRINGRAIQDILIDSGFARIADENFMSKVDHDLRIRTQAANNSHIEDECDIIADEMRKMMPFEEDEEIVEPDDSKRHITIRLNGPKSPLQSTIYMCLHQRSDSKKIVIEQSSVNSILLEANPQDSFEKFVVAASVTENEKKTELTARETTIMPNIPGFGPLMALIFSPYCEFFRDKHKSRYVAVLCGLGEHPTTKQPIYGEHDALFNLDADIDVEDIENINTIRFIMDSLLQMRPDQKHPAVTDADQNQLTIQMKTKIIALLEKERPLMGLPYDFDVGWSKFPPADLIRAKDVFGKSAIFPFHNILNLTAADSPERLQQIRRLIENNNDLHYMAQTNLSLVRPKRCLLCYLDLQSLAELKVHLYSRLHTDREKTISVHF